MYAFLLSSPDWHKSDLPQCANCDAACKKIKPLDLVLASEHEHERRDTASEQQESTPEDTSATDISLTAGTANRPLDNCNRPCVGNRQTCLKVRT